MPPGRDEIFDQLIELFRDIIRIGHSSFPSEWLQLELSMAQLKALYALAGNEPATIGRLSQRLGIRLPATSLLVDRLVHLELVERWEDPDDRRRTLVRLTPQASSLVERLQQGRREQLRAWLSALDDAQLKGLEAGLRAILAAATAAADDTPKDLHLAQG